MKRHLISEKGQFYKVCLHSHTNLSDGLLSPEQTKQAYIEKGYSAVAFTDHDIFICHNDLTDDKFLALNGYEVEIEKNIDGAYPYNREKCCHLCYVAISPKTTRQVCFHREKYLHRSKNLDINSLDFDSSAPNYERTYSHECINDMIKQGVDNGFFVTYNHPTWSGESYPDYMGYNGMHAMEIFNGECVNCGLEEFNSRVYDDMLRGGKMLYCTATDDMHKTQSVGLGWIYVKAPSLTYENLTSAILKGDFYSSTGAKINALYVEDGFIFVECEQAKQIALSMGIMKVEKVNAQSEPLTKASFRLHPSAKYVRLTVTDLDGNKAYTNAYSVEDLLK